MRSHVTLTLEELAHACGASVRGEPHTRIAGVGTLLQANESEITFLTNPLYRHQLASSRAAAVILKPQDVVYTQLPCLVTPDPHACYAKVAWQLFPRAVVPAERHPTSVVHAHALVDPTVSLGSHVVVEEGAVIGAGTVVSAGCFIGAHVEVGADVILHPHVILYAGTRLGARSVVHAGAVLGADGFGMAWDRDRWLKIPQVGCVIVGADVEIGANTTIDRGAIDNTVIEDGVKLDNLIQIAHNCHIGAHTVIAGCTGISGSTRIGRGCRIGGGVGIVGHVEIGDGVTVSGFSLITKSIHTPGVYTSSIPSQPHRDWLKTLAHLRHLPALVERLEALEAQRADE